MDPFIVRPPFPTQLRSSGCSRARRVFVSLGASWEPNARQERWHVAQVRELILPHCRIAAGRFPMAAFPLGTALKPPAKGTTKIRAHTHIRY